MLGAAVQSRGSVAALVESYRAHGLFKRWPITYIATHGPGSVATNTRIAAKAAHQFASLLAAERRMVVHAHMHAGAGFWRDAAFIAAAFAARCPVALHLHGAGFDARLTWFLERAAIVCVSCEAMRTWVRSVARNADVAVVPPPAALAVSDIGAKPKLVLFLGRLAAEKGAYDLLEAVAAVRAKIPELRLVYAGEGDRIGLARYAERLQVADAVKFMGWVGPSGKRALFEHAAVLALPSYEEALPLALIEAMSAGVPVIAAPVGGIAEVVAEGASGLLVAPGDQAGLQRALARVLMDAELAARLAAAARETARLRFAPERALGALEDVYDALGVNGFEERRARAPVALRRAA